MVDCDGDNRPDLDEIELDEGLDQNGNGRLDSCDADIDNDGMVGASDLIQVILNWGFCGRRCAADVTGDGYADVEDLVFVLMNWG